MRIFIVEDEFLIAAVMQDYLEAAGYRVVGPALSVPEALLAIEAEKDPLGGAFLDLNLRGTPVFPVAEELARRGVPFIFSTGYGDNAAMPAPFRDTPTIGKPWTEHALRDAALRVFGPPQF